VKSHQTTAPYSAVTVAAIGYFVGLFDTFLLPALRIPSLKEIGILDADSLATYTTIFNYQLAGMTLGALFLWGPFADSRGRRKILLGSIIVYSLAGILTAAVQDTTQYSIIRFIAGVGLGGELGAGVTLVSENMDRKRRGVGSTIIVGIGVLGVVCAALISKTSIHWRMIYVIGGVLGLLLLGFRIGVGESRLFEKNRSENLRSNYFRTLRLLVTWPNLIKYVACVLVGTPIFFIVGLLVPGAPEFSKAFGLKEVPAVSTALIWTYLSIAMGHIFCGFLSQLLRSRKKAILIFHGITMIAICTFLFTPPVTPAGFYFRCALAGIGLGYWANLVTNAAEQFGTNVRGTVTITAPNFIRFLLFPISAAFFAMRPSLGIIGAGAIVGLGSSVVAVIATLSLKDKFDRDLDYNEDV